MNIDVWSSGRRMVEEIRRTKNIKSVFTGFFKVDGLIRMERHSDFRKWGLTAHWGGIGH